MAGITDGFTGAVGHTPLIRLRALSELTGCDILGKAEFMNPGGSVKDRAALGILQAAEANGQLGPGGTVVEGTAGNTGIGLAHLCNARGYRCLIVIPETQSAEKIAQLRILGAEVRTVPAVPYADPNNYVKLSGRTRSWDSPSSTRRRQSRISPRFGLVSRPLWGRGWREPAAS